MVRATTIIVILSAGATLTACAQNPGNFIDRRPVVRCEKIGSGFTCREGRLPENAEPPHRLTPGDIDRMRRELSPTPAPAAPSSIRNA